MDCHPRRRSGKTPTKPEEPELTDLLKTRVAASPQQDLVTKLTAPGPVTETEIVAQLKTQVTDLKRLSIRKTQLQGRLDQLRAQYATLLQDMQELQTKLMGNKSSRPSRTTT